MINKCRLSIRTSDKILYISLMILAILCFIGSLVIFAISFTIGLEFAESYGECSVINTTDCYKYIISNYNLSKDFIWTFIGLLLAVNGTIISIFTVSLFKLTKKD